MTEKYPILQKFSLNTMPLWRNIPENVWNELSENSTIRKYKKSEDILKEGSYSEGIYIMRKGIIKIYQVNKNGDEQIINILGENYIFGHASVLSDEPNTTYVTAITDCEVELISKDSFLTQLKRSIELNSLFLNYSGQLYRIMNNELTTFARKPLYERIALALLLLNEKLKLDGVLSFTREDLANYIGTAIESLVRQLKKLKEANLISVNGRKITLVDMDQLYIIANESN